MPAPTSSLSLSAALRWAWRAYRANTGLYLTVVLTLFASWAVLEILVYLTQLLGSFVNLALHLAFLFAFAGLSAGFIEICLQAAQDERPVYRTLFSKFRLAPAMLAAQLIYLALVILGLVPLVLPGLLVAVYFAFFGFTLITSRLNPLRALATSGSLARAHGLFVSGALLLLFLLNLLGAALLGLGLLVTVPVSLLTLTALYFQLVRASFP
jgi:hypothetical protein